MILIIDNYDSFTYNLVQRLGELDASLSIHVARNDRITPAEAIALNPTHIIISPGPCTPRESGVSPEIIRAFAGHIPILGVCLGHQCLGDMHGMTVARHAVAMHGKASPILHDNRGLFRNLPNPFTAARYHSLVILENTIPPLAQDGSGWQVSAWTNEPIDGQSGGQSNSQNNGPSDAANSLHALNTPPTRRVVMGLRRVWSETERTTHHGAPLEGVQFHPESFLTEEGPRLLQNFLRAVGTSLPC